VWPSSGSSWSEDACRITKDYFIMGEMEQLEAKVHGRLSGGRLAVTIRET
jgi:hypothetical protein